jgi:hypothetical protein
MTTLFKEANTQFFHIKDVDEDLFMLLLRYLYTNQVENLTVDLAVELLVLANKYP